MSFVYQNKYIKIRKTEFWFKCRKYPPNSAGH